MLNKIKTLNEIRKEFNIRIILSSRQPIGNKMAVYMTRYKIPPVRYLPFMYKGTQIELRD